MRALLLLILILFAAVASFAASPSYFDFVGTNGIIIRSNPPIGKLIIDGAGIALGVAPAVAPGTNVTVQTNIVSGRTVYTVNSSGGGTATGAITNVSDAANNGISLIYTSNNFSVRLVTLQAGANIWITNNGTNIVIAGQGTNGFVTASITNGLVTAAITNGLATISYVDTSINFASNVLVTLIVDSTNTLSGNLTLNINSASNSLLSQITTATNTLSAAGRAELNSASNSLVTQITGATNTLAASGRSELNSASNSLVTQIIGATNTLAANGRTELNSASNSLVSQITTTSNGISDRLDGKVDENGGVWTNGHSYGWLTVHNQQTNQSTLNVEDALRTHEILPLQNENFSIGEPGNQYLNIRALNGFFGPLTATNAIFYTSRNTNVSVKVIGGSQTNAVEVFDNNNNRVAYVKTNGYWMTTNDAHAFLTTTGTTSGQTNDIYTFTMRTNCTVRVFTDIVGFNITNSCSYGKIGTFRDNGGVVAQVGAIGTLGSAEDNSLDESIIDLSGTTIRIRVAGTSNSTMNWSAYVKLIYACP